MLTKMGTYSSIVPTIAFRLSTFNLHYLATVIKVASLALSLLSSPSLQLLSLARDLTAFTSSDTSATLVFFMAQQAETETGALE